MENKESSVITFNRVSAISTYIFYVEDDDVELKIDIIEEDNLYDAYTVVAYKSKNPDDKIVLLAGRDDKCDTKALYDELVLEMVTEYANKNIAKQFP